MSYEINRTFTHKKFGKVGEAKLTGTAELSLDGSPLPDESVKYLLTFALQSLQDAYAGAKDEAEAKGSFSKKLDKLVKGEIGVRAANGESITDEDVIRAKIVISGAKMTFATGTKTADRYAAALARYAAAPEATRAQIDKLVAAQVEREREAREAAAALSF